MLLGYIKRKWLFLLIVLILLVGNVWVWWDCCLTQIIWTNAMWNTFFQIIAALIGGSVVSVVYEMYRDKMAREKEEEHNNVIRGLFVNEVFRTLSNLSKIPEDARWQSRPVFNSFYTSNSHLITVFKESIATYFTNFYSLLSLLQPAHDKSYERLVLQMLVDKKETQAEEFKTTLKKANEVNWNNIIDFGNALLKSIEQEYPGEYKAPKPFLLYGAEKT